MTRKPVGWRGEPRRHSAAARMAKRPHIREKEPPRKPLPILTMVKESARQDYKRMTPYGKHLALAYTAGFDPYSRQEFEERRRREASKREVTGRN